MQLSISAESFHSLLCPTPPRAARQVGWPGCKIGSSELSPRASAQDLRLLFAKTKHLNPELLGPQPGYDWAQKAPDTLGMRLPSEQSHLKEALLTALCSGADGGQGKGGDIQIPQHSPLKSGI